MSTHYQELLSAIKRKNENDALRSLLRLQSQENWLLIDSLEASVTVDSKGRYTILHLAVEKNLEEVTQMLLEFGALANAVSQVAGGPLHAAILNGNLHIAELLLSKGASPWQADGKGRSAMDEAVCFDGPFVQRLADLALFSSDLGVKVSKLGGLTSKYETCHVILAPHIAFGLANTPRSETGKLNYSQQAQSNESQLCMFVCKEVDGSRKLIGKLWLGGAEAKLIPDATKSMAVIYLSDPVKGGSLHCVSDGGKFQLKIRQGEGQAAKLGDVERLVEAINKGLAPKHHASLLDHGSGSRGETPRTVTPRAATSRTATPRATTPRMGSYGTMEPPQYSNFGTASALPYCLAGRAFNPKPLESSPNYTQSRDSELFNPFAVTASPRHQQDGSSRIPSAHNIPHTIESLQQHPYLQRQQDQQEQLYQQQYQVQQHQQQVRSLVPTCSLGVLHSPRDSGFETTASNPPSAPPLPQENQTLAHAAWWAGNAGMPSNVDGAVKLTAGASRVTLGSKEGWPPAHGHPPLAKTAVNGSARKRWDTAVPLTEKRSTGGGSSTSCSSNPACLSFSSNNSNSSVDHTVGKIIPEVEGLCIVCLTSPAVVGFMHKDSVHRAVCQDCSPRFHVGTAACPLCREPIEKKLAIY